MKSIIHNQPPADAASRRAIEPVVCYPRNSLTLPPLDDYLQARKSMNLVESLQVPPREARSWIIPAGHFCRISCIEGPQVGDLDLFSADNLDEHLYTGKTRAISGTHVGPGDQLYSSLPWLRPMATIVRDTLDWYGIDSYGGAVHDVIGTRCDPYTQYALGQGQHYHHCCHSNLVRALARHCGLTFREAEPYIHDVLNVFMCTGFTRDTGQYFMKASPVRPGDYLEFFAEIDLVAVMSACPGGDCSTEHSSDKVHCYPMGVEVFRPAQLPDGWQPSAINGYSPPTTDVES